MSIFKDSGNLYYVPSKLDKAYLGTSLVAYIGKTVRLLCLIELHKPKKFRIWVVQ